MNTEWMKILVVDDDVVARMVLMHLIASCGEFDIVEADDGADAWQQLEGGLRPALCFCDLRMPRLSGMALLEKVKGQPGLATMPFVLVSSAAERATVRQASECGAAAYIVKPFQAADVRAQLAALLVQADPPAAETPRATQQRLGISAERLLVCLNGLQRQLAAAGSAIDALGAQGEMAERQSSIERLHVACVTLGLFAAAAQLKHLVPGQLSGAALPAALAVVQRAVSIQASRVA